MDPELEGYIEIIDDTRSSLPISIVTGDADTYREPCEQARDIFMAAGHPVKFTLLPDTPHWYQTSCETDVCNFFLSNRLPEPLCEFWSNVQKVRQLGLDASEELAGLARQLDENA